MQNPWDDFISLVEEEILDIKAGKRAYGIPLGLENVMEDDFNKKFTEFRRHEWMDSLKKRYVEFLLEKDLEE